MQSVTLVNNNPCIKITRSGVTQNISSLPLSSKFLPVEGERNYLPKSEIFFTIKNQPDYVRASMELGKINLGEGREAELPLHSFKESHRQFYRDMFADEEVMKLYGDGTRTPDYTGEIRIKFLALL